MIRTSAPGAFDRRWLLLPLALLAVVLVSTLGYCIIERMNVLDALYMTVITITTVGYSEVKPLTPAGQMWTLGVIVFGVGTAAWTFSLAVAAITEGQVRRLLGRRHLERTIESLSGHTIVCGYGRMGQMTAEDLNGQRRLVIVEQAEERLQVAETDGLLYVRGDALDEEVLKLAGVERAEALVACLASDADNVFLTLTARQINHSITIIARAELLRTQRKLHRAGATHVVCPHVIGARRMADVILRPALVDFFDVASRGVDLEMDQLVLTDGGGLAGKSLRELALPAHTGAMIVAVRSADGRTIYNPGPELSLSTGDAMILVGPRGSAEKVQKLQGNSTSKP